jgi:FkbM family methyltransferase
VARAAGLVGRVIERHGLWWPDGTADRQMDHALNHVCALEWTIALCAQRRVAVQAGGNVGLWPRRLAQDFAQVITFEPDAESRECLLANVPSNVTIFQTGLGESVRTVGLQHRSLGSHRIVDGSDHAVVTLDPLVLFEQVDLIQLDVEGYEWHALAGARQTIARCRPVIQVELRGFTEKYGKTDADVRMLLRELGYGTPVARPGSDFVFFPKGQS